MTLTVSGEKTQPRARIALSRASARRRRPRSPSSSRLATALTAAVVISIFILLTADLLFRQARVALQFLRAARPVRRSVHGGCHRHSETRWPLPAAGQPSVA